MSKPTQSAQSNEPNGHVCVLRQAVYPITTPPTAREVDALVSAGYRVTVITQRRHGNLRLPAFEKQGRVTIYRLSGGRRKGSKLRYIFEYGFFFLQAVVLVTVLHLRHRFKVIQVNTMPDFLVFVTIIPRLLGARILLMMKEPTPELWETIYGRKPSRLIIWVEQAAMRYAHRVFTVTENLRQTYIQRGANADKIQVMLNVPRHEYWLGVDAPERQHTTFTLICHGTLEARYGHDVILDAVHIARETIPDIRLRLMGAGRLAGSILQMIAERGLSSNVDFLGWVSHEQLVSEIKAADVGVVGLRSSPYSNLIHTNKMYEYMLFEKPVMLSRLQAVSDIFDDDAVAFYAPGDAQDLARQIVRLYNDPELRDSIAKRAHDRCMESFSWHLERERYLATYAALAQR